MTVEWKAPVPKPTNVLPAQASIHARRRFTARDAQEERRVDPRLREDDGGEWGARNSDNVGLREAA